MIDIKFESLKQDLKPKNKHSIYNSDFSHQEKTDVEHSKLMNKPKKNVTFVISSEDKISDESNDMLNTCKNVNTNVVDSNISMNNMCTNSTFIKNIPNLNVNTNSLSKNIPFDSMKINVDSKKVKNKDDFDIQTNKRKKIEVQSDFEFKKPYNPVQVEISTNLDIIDIVNSQTINPALINKKVFINIR